MVVHVRFDNPTVSVTGAAAGQADECAIYRWCDYPGERLFQKVSFDVNGNPLDEYYPDTYNFHRQFFISESKRSGWNKCMGQEQSVEAFSTYKSTADTTPQNARAGVLYRNGFQTYKTEAGHIGNVAGVVNSSLAQIADYGGGSSTVSGGEVTAGFFVGTGSVSIDLTQVRDLGNSILGGGGTTSNTQIYPDGPDTLTIVVTNLSTTTSAVVFGRLSWTEAQA